MAAYYKTVGPCSLPFSERKRFGGLQDQEVGDDGYCKLQTAVAAFVLIAVALAVSLVAGEQRRPGPSRIVSVVPAVTEMLFAIGAGNEVVGVSSFDKFPPEVRTRPQVGALIDPDFERILSLKPDLVVTYASQNDFISRLARAKVPTFLYEHGGLAEVTDTILRVGDRVGRADEAAKLAGRIRRELDEIRRSVAGRKRPRTVLIFEREPGTLRGIYAGGGVGFMHDMLETAGGDDVFGDVKRQSVQATAELMLARAPDVILEIHPSATWTPERLRREQDAWRALSSLPAVRSGRIHFLTDDRVSIPGPRVAEAVRLMSQKLHPPSARVDLPPAFLRHRLPSERSHSTATRR
jgi:iron complex transport system substrate-binding protein